VTTPSFWLGKRVFVTGHTGFKGAWLCLLLRHLGATVRGYALPPPTDPSLYALASAGEGIDSIEGDLRDLPTLCAALHGFEPAVVLHLAAQSVVFEAYRDPVDTYATNVMGTVHLLEAVRRAGLGVAVVNVTTDKVYLERQPASPHGEDDPLGGHDPYSNSKACAELVARAYAASYFAGTRVALASARAGNVIGGGDWTPHQLVPAVIAAAQSGRAVQLRHPESVRPWQHVLDCLSGYLSLAERLVSAPPAGNDGWNFGPAGSEVITVADVAQRLAGHWGLAPGWVAQANVDAPREERELRLDSSRAASELGWHCRLDIMTAIDWVADWYRAVERGSAPRHACQRQIEAFLALPASWGRA
jgi:CDP-glucose 4,6-dehydratase